MTAPAPGGGKKPDRGYYFDKSAADHAVEFFEKHLKHTKGEWAGRPFKLRPWQSEQLIRPLFGWKRADGSRRYRMVYCEIPKKNGKSETAAGVGLYCTFADGEPGAEVFSAAGDREQARIVFDTAKTMVENSPALKRRADVYRGSIVYPKLGCSYKVLSSDAFTKHGFNVHCAVFDEFHVQPNRELYDTLRNGTAARRQPITFIITTAGHGRESICWELHDYSMKVKKGIIDDPELLVVIFRAEPEDDWTSEATWKKANPNYGITVKPEFFRSECEKAKRLPAYENVFKRLHLNMWTSAETRWLRMEDWDASAGQVPDLKELRGRDCYAALDLSSSLDITALGVNFPWEDDAYKLYSKFWIPAENMRERILHDHVPYDAWAKEGYVEPTEGNVIDYRFIIAELKRLRDEVGLKILEIAYDPWGATKIVQDLEELGFKMVPFRQGFGSMSGPSKDFERLVLGKKLHHGGNPVLRWMMDNCVVKVDPAGNIKPDKSKSHKRIDGVVAHIMALDRAMRRETKTTGSVYDKRGFQRLGG